MYVKDNLSTGEFISQVTDYSAPKEEEEEEEERRYYR